MAKVLVVDDHPHIVRLVQRELEEEGHEVITAADGEEALVKIRTEQPRLVVLDVLMPKMNGYDVLRAVKSDPATCQIAVILLTVMDHAEEITHALRLGADTYLIKPFIPGDIACLVGRFVASGLVDRAGGITKTDRPATNRSMPIARLALS